MAKPELLRPQDDVEEYIRAYLITSPLSPEMIADRKSPKRKTTKRKVAKKR